MSGPANTLNDGSAPRRKHRHTGWAILFALIGSIIFYVIYRILFTFVIAAYASYDPRFGSGLGALVLLVFGSTALGCLSGTVVAQKLFPRASSIGLFYGLSSLLVVSGVLSTFVELNRYDYSWMVIAINIAVIAVSIFLVRFVLIDNDDIN